MKRIAIAAFVAFAGVLAPVSARAQQPVIPGYNETVGCGAFAPTPCFIPYSPSNPFPISGNHTGIDVAITPTIQNAAYASGNCMGGFQTVALGSSVSVLSQISLASQGGLATAKQIYIFSANPTGSTCTDKSTFTIATADLSKLIYTGSITPAAPTGTTKTWGALSNLALGIYSGGTVYAAIVETASETPASTTDLVMTFSAL